MWLAELSGICHIGWNIYLDLCLECSPFASRSPPSSPESSWENLLAFSSLFCCGETHFDLSRNWCFKPKKTKKKHQRFPILQCFVSNSKVGCVLVQEVFCYVQVTRHRTRRNRRIFFSHSRILILKGVWRFLCDMNTFLCLWLLWAFIRVS